MVQLSPSQIAQWHRQKSAEHLAQAEQIERDYNLSSTSPPKLPDANHTSVQQSKSDIKPAMETYLKQIGAKRPADIAAHLSTTKEEVLKVVEEYPEIFTKAAKGWIKLTTTKDISTY